VDNSLPPTLTAVRKMTPHETLDKQGFELTLKVILSEESSPPSYSIQ